MGGTVPSTFGRKCDGKSDGKSDGKMLPSPAGQTKAENSECAPLPPGNVASPVASPPSDYSDLSPPLEPGFVPPPPTPSLPPSCSPTRLPLPPHLSLPSLASTLSSLLTLTSTDYTFNKKKAKWACVSCRDCTYLRFNLQVYSCPTSQSHGETRTTTHVLTVARLEGSCCAFSKVTSLIRSAVLASSSLPPTTPDFLSNLSTHPHLRPPPRYLSPRNDPVVTTETLRPLVDMSASEGVDRRLYAAVGVARILEGGESGWTAVAESAVLPNLISTTETIDMRSPLPLEHSLLLHLTRTLATLSSLPSTHPPLAASLALPLCFRLVKGALNSQTVPPAKCTALDVESRREAARCLANILSPPHTRSAMLALLKSAVRAGEYNEWKVLVGEFEDEKLRNQCGRICGYIEQGV